jgi:hypothetical protein
MWGQLLVKWLNKFIVKCLPGISKKNLEIGVMIAHSSSSSACVVAVHVSKETMQLYIISL